MYTNPPYTEKEDLESAMVVRNFTKRLTEDMKQWYSEVQDLNPVIRLAIPSLEFKTLGALTIDYQFFKIHCEKEGLWDSLPPAPQSFRMLLQACE